jgi:replicative DNA helicase
MLGLLELLKPSTYVIEVSFFCALQNKKMLDLIKNILPYWSMLATEEQKPLLSMLTTFVNKGIPEHDFKLSQPLEFYYKLFDVANLDELQSTILDRLYKIQFIAKVYEKIQLLQHPIHDYNKVERLVSELLSDLNEVRDKELTEKIFNAKDLLNVTEISDLKLVSLIPELDLVLGGFYVNNLYLFAAGLGQGKSFTLLNMAVGFSVFLKAFENYYKDWYGKKPVVLYISLENTSVQIRNRLYTLLNDCTLTIPKEKNTPLKQLFQAVDNFYVISLSDEIVDYVYIENIVLSMQSKNMHPVVIVLDYMDELYAPANISEYRHKLGYNARMLRKIAMNHNLLVVSATQINRKGIEEGNISITHLSESIEHGKVTDALIGLVPVTINKGYIITNQPLTRDIIKSNLDNKADAIGMINSMYLKVLKNRPNLLTGFGYAISNQSLTGFRSLIYGLNYEISIYLVPSLHSYLGDDYITTNYDVLHNSVTNRIAPFVKNLDVKDYSKYQYGLELISNLLGIDIKQINVNNENIENDFVVSNINQNIDALDVIDDFEAFEQKSLDLDI